jgi:hypothetical protein
MANWLKKASKFEIILLKTYDWYEAETSLLSDWESFE